MRRAFHVATTPGRLSKHFNSVHRQFTVIKEQGGKHEPFGADGSGYYSDNTKGCFDVIRNASDLVLEAAAQLVDRSAGIASDHTPFVIADYGTADGGTSMPLIYAVVQQVRQQAPKRPIFVWYEDQAQNDFKSLFLRLHQQIPGPASYLADFDNVYCMASGTTFYDQCFPHNSVDLAFSATAMHWLTRAPCQFDDVLHSAMATGIESEKYRDQAAEDWSAILLNRTKELKPGGAMVIVNFAVDEHGDFLGKTARVKENMHGWFRDIWAQMATEGKITMDEFRATNFPNQVIPLQQWGTHIVGTKTQAHKRHIHTTLS
jgi:hypothetical protein